MNKLKLVVVGDVLLDADLSGGANRLCPDAPVPVVDVATVSRRAGGAGLVASMLAKDGHDVELVTVLSDDDSSVLLRNALEGMAVVAGPSGAPTPVKSRVRVDNQSVVRFDEGCETPPVPEVTQDMLRALERADAVVVADYGRRLAENAGLRKALTELAGRSPVVWDPHPAGADPVPGVAAITPNMSEALKMSGSTGSGSGFETAVEAGTTLRERWNGRAVVVTRGSGGAVILTRDGLPQAVPAPKVSIEDPCGAGDRFASALAVSLAHGHVLADAVEAAVGEAASFLAAGGVAAMAREPEPAQLPGAGVDALRVAASVRSSGGTLVATGGCFDLLHAGHARTLAAARKLGDALIVCLNSDASVRRLKGEQRPIMAEQDRVELLLALECVDAVMVFDEDTPESALDTLRPHIWVKGGDYTADSLPETALLKTWGGKTVTVPFYPARSTSRLADALERVG